MDFAKEQTKKRNFWTNEYADKIFSEYERFMVLKNIDEECSPSDDIDSLWHQIILDTELYWNYCTEKFNKIIHHKPQNSIDQHARKLRLEKTIGLYKNIFNEEPDKIVWETLYCGICSELVKKNYFFSTNCCDNSNNCKKCLKKIKSCPNCDSQYIFCGKEPYPIVIKQLDTGEVINLIVSGSDTIANLKNKIAEIRGIPSDEIRLIFEGEQLNDLKNIFNYGVYKEAQIFMTLRLRGC